MIMKCSEVAKKVFDDIRLVSPSEGQSIKTSLAGSFSQASTRVLELRARLAGLKPGASQPRLGVLILMALEIFTKNG